MIISKFIKVQIRSRSKYWSEILGYKVGYHDVIDIPINKMPRDSNKNVEYKCDNCGQVDERSLQMLNKSEIHLCYRCSRKSVGCINKQIQTGKPREYQRGDKHPRWNPNKDAYALYRAKVYTETRKNKKTYSTWENYDKIGRCGVEGAYQLDHIISIKHGFDNNICPSVIGHITNLQIITWEENRRKSDKHEVKHNGINGHY